MNLRRGLLRLWAVFAVVWIAAVVYAGSTLIALPPGATLDPEPGELATVELFGQIVLIDASHVEWALGPPIIALIIGAALWWAAVGFKMINRVNRYSGQPMTFGNAAVARVRLIVWCLDYQVENRTDQDGMNCGAGQALDYPAQRIDRRHIEAPQAFDDAGPAVRHGAAGNSRTPLDRPRLRGPRRAASGSTTAPAARCRQGAGLRA